MTLKSAMVALGLGFITVQGAWAMSSNLGGSSDTDSSASQSSYSDAETAVRQGEYRQAIEILDGIVASEPDNVDAYNYLGYSHRQLGEYDKSMEHYQRALSIDADHRGANEYLGRLFLLQGNLEKAEEQLGKLERICGSGCEEHDSLRAAIQDYRRRS